MNFPDDFRAAQAGDVAARNRLVMDNMGLAYRAMARMGIRREDGLADATLALIRAVEKFDPDLGFAFSTYARQWLTQYLARGRQMDQQLVRVTHQHRREGDALALAEAALHPVHLDHEVDGLTLHEMIPADTTEPADVIERARVRAVLGKLPRASVWTLQQLAHGRSLQEIGCCEGVSRQAVSQRVEKAREVLRRRLAA